MRSVALLSLVAIGSLCRAQQTGEQLLMNAASAYREGRVDEAFSLANEAIEVAPADPTGYFIRGTVFESRQDYGQALADYDRVVDLSPSLPLAYNRRGGLRFKLGDFDGSVADFDREIALDSTKGDNHWQRGLSYYYARRFEDCRKQFELSFKTVNPNDYENGIFHFLCSAAERGLQKARKDLLPIQGDERVPMKQIYDLYQGRGSVQDVLVASELGNPAATELKDRLFYAHLYLGLYFDVAGDRQAAFGHLSRAVENFQVAHYMWDVGRVHLQSLSSELASLPSPAEPPGRPPAKQKLYRDPKSPKLRSPAPQSPEPRPHPNVTFHHAPKPLSSTAATHDWTSFLGPTHNAISTETELLEHFPETGPPLVWEMQTGTGYTSPAIAGDRLVYLHRVGDRERIECLHPETGELYWQHEYGSDFSDRYGYNNGPRASPVIDGDRVYTYGAQAVLQCRRLDSGELIWERDIAREFKVKQGFFGVAGTPLVEGDLLIANVGAPDGPTVAAFDKLTGEMVWGAGQWGAGYASPIPATVHGDRRLFIFGGGESRPPTGGLLMVEPLSGQVELTFPWRSKTYESVNASTPVVVDNRVFFSASYQTGAAVLEIAPSGGREVSWVNPDFDLHFTTPVHHEGHLYGFSGRNEPDASLVSVDLKTGREKWRAVPEWKETVMANGKPTEITESTYRGSLLKVDGRFLALGEHGHLLWLDLAPDGYRILSRASLFKARETWALPVLSRGLLYVSQNRRSTEDGTPPRLLCYDLRAPK